MSKEFTPLYTGAYTATLDLDLGTTLIDYHAKRHECQQLLTDLRTRTVIEWNPDRVATGNDVTRILFLHNALTLLTYRLDNLDDSPEPADDAVSFRAAPTARCPLGLAACGDG